jgi:hypothetical protein
VEAPTLTDYVTLIFTLFERFVQEYGAELDWNSNRYDYPHKTLIVFFMMMQQRRKTKFKAQWRWLKTHPDECQRLGFETVPDRSTLSRRYKALYPVLQAFIAFVGQYAEELDERLTSRDLSEDKSLFKGWMYPSRVTQSGYRCHLVQKRLSRLGLRLQCPFDL